MLYGSGERTSTGVNETSVSLRNYSKGKKDNIIRAVKCWSKKTNIERPIQFLYPLELSFDTWKRQKTVHQCSKQPLNLNASKFRPRRNAAAITEVRI